MLSAYSISWWVISLHGFSYHCYADITQPAPYFPSMDSFCSDLSRHLIMDGSLSSHLFHLHIRILSSPWTFWSHIRSLHIPLGCPWTISCHFPISHPLWFFSSEGFVNFFHTGYSGACSTPCLVWITSTRSWQICLWAPFDLCNWSIRQLSDLFLTFPLLRSLYWLPVAACTRFKRIKLAC